MNSALLWSILFWGWIALELSVALLTRTRSNRGCVADRGTQIVLILVIASAMTTASFLAAMHLMPIPLPGLKLVSLLLMMTGLLVRLTAIFSLGKSFSANVAMRTGQQLKHDGLYALVRHPSYTGLWLIFLAYGLHRGDGLSVAVALVPTTAVLIYRIQVEEAVLRSAFGEAYDDYARTTRRLIPFLY